VVVVTTTVVVVVVAVVGGAVVVVVEVVAHPEAVQASQQFENVPTQAVPPFGARQWAASLRTEHLVTPVVLVWQHVTNPGLPHVEREMQRLTALRQLGFCKVALTCKMAQRT
jgi:hypothetical protein